MCGFAGIINLDGSPVDRDTILAMTDIQAHRGPDESGYYFSDGVGLGHRRLSIIDLSSGKQPMCNEEGTIWITYNGEIYNFRELRNELTAKNHIFKTKSDTEVIIHAFEQWGEACLSRFIGMFAFAVWDCKRKKVFLARDRLGIKPLHFYIDKNRFVFASELKAFSKNDLIPKIIDEQSLIAYLRFGYVPSPYTIFKEIKKVLPGHYITIDLTDGGQCRQTEYWDLRFEPSRSITYEDWKERLHDLLKDSVKRRLISDVPLGAFLSGGVDSSTVVALMSELQADAVKTFTIGFEEQDFSEIQHARDVAKRFSTEHHEMIVKPDALDLLPKLAWQYDEPFGDSSAIPTYYVSKIAREEVKVVLSGDGGDELFAGYDHYRAIKRFTPYYRIPTIVRRLGFRLTSSILPKNTRGMGFLERLSMNSSDLPLDFSSIFPSSLLDKMLSENLKKQNNKSAHEVFREYFDRQSEADFVSRMQYLDTKTYLPDDILVKVDRASMMNSLEVRVPMLDHRVVELAAKMPIEYKFKNNKGKYILKDTFNGLLPPSVIRRPKMGFAIPISKWLKKDLFEYASDMLLNGNSSIGGFVNRREVGKMLLEHKLSRKDHDSRLWNLLILEEWLRAWRARE